MKVVYRSNKGLIRKNNEDNLIVETPKMFAVADGMGGHLAGDVASYETIHTLGRTDFSNVASDKIKESIIARIKEINCRISELANNNSDLKGMGTTLSLIYMIDENKAVVAHVGDSRIYFLNQTGLKQLTVDHSFVSELVKKHRITKKEAESHPQKNILMRAVGGDNVIQVDCFEVLLNGVKKIILCSDGLSDMIGFESIEKNLLLDDIEVIADTLLKKALDAGGRDNISFIIIDLEE